MLISMKFKNIFVSLILSAVFCTNAFAYDGVNLNINGKDITSEVAPRLINERTMVPVRAILEEIGASVNWNEEQRTVTAEKGNTKFSMALDEDFYTVNGKVVSMDSKAVIVKNRVLVPARYVAQAFGLKVEWNSDDKTVYINEGNATTEETTETTTEKVENTEVTQTQKKVCDIITNALNTYTVGKDDLDEFKVGTYKKATNEMVEKIKELKAETTDKTALDLIEQDLKFVDKVESYLQQCDLYSKYAKTDNAKQNQLLFKHSLLDKVSYLSECKTVDEAKKIYNDLVDAYDNVVGIVNRETDTRYRVTRDLEYYATPTF